MENVTKTEETGDAEKKLKEADTTASNLIGKALPTFGNPDKYGFDKIKTDADDKKKSEDEAHAIVGSE